MTAILPHLIDGSMGPRFPCNGKAYDDHGSIINVHQSIPARLASVLLAQDVLCQLLKFIFQQNNHQLNAQCHFKLLSFSHRSSENAIKKQQYVNTLADKVTFHPKCLSKN
ncbi:hypothetical protein SAY86_013332 [Trapa natans]|uniref:Uncharacterized protein n=1 Tax=Trapa natans TaxID=22666 RepID=A0AAN7ME99_TRANT|nr:hypothetical protein SAY86_013332 [Trapa natans]